MSRRPGPAPLSSYADASRTARSVAWCALASLFALACTRGDEPADEGGLRVRWPLGDTQALDERIDRIQVVVEVGGGAGDPYEFTVMRQPVRDGRRVPSVPLLESLPFGQTIWIRLRGFVGLDEDPIARGSVGPIVLEAGERRYIDVQMYEIGVPNVVPPTGLTPRFLHTATSLEDGRVLIAGGFTATRDATCPASEPMGSRCFALTATDDAWIFDASTGRVLPVQGGGMLTPRAGHTATRLRNGRVLFAGGVESATLVMRAIGMDSGRFEPRFVGTGGAGPVAALATFEIFDPSENQEREDLDRDGDPGRGGFVGGGADLRAPGAMNRGRFLHAAVAIPSERGDVEHARALVVGGLGSDAGARSFEVYDDDRPGGHGFYNATSNTLASPREMPGAAAVERADGAPARIWIVGGVARPTSNADLAEIWTPDARSPNGSIAVASMGTSFPGTAAGMTDPRPSAALLRPHVTPADRRIMGPMGMSSAGLRQRLLVLGWFGPLCAPGMTTPVFAMGAEPLEPCGAVPAMGQVRNLLINNSDGVVTALPPTIPHRAFAAVAQLDDRRVVLTGGAADLTFETRQSGELLNADGTATGEPISLDEPRMMHTSTELLDEGVFSFGGVRVMTGARGLEIVGSSEVVYLAPPPPVRDADP